MRSDKYNNNDIRRDPSDDRWEETQMLFRDRDKQRDEMKKRQEYEERRRQYEELRSMSSQRAQDPDEEARRRKEAAYREYLEMRKHPDANRSPEYDDRARTYGTSRESDAYSGDRVKKKQPILNKEPDRYEKKEQRRSRARENREAEEYNIQTKAEKKAMKKSRKASGGGKRSSGKAGRVGKAVMALLMVVVIVAAAAFLLLSSKLSKVGDIYLDKYNLGIDPMVAEELKDYRNIVLLGIDSRDMDDYEKSRTDAIIIMSIDKANGEIRQISVFRDTYMYIDEKYGYDKITNVHAYLGTDGTIRTLNKNMDLNIEEVAIVNWKAVADVIDGLGGVEIDVQESELKELNKITLHTQSIIGGSTDTLDHAGLQTLNGNQAVAYSRIRKDSAQGDYRRNERMKIMLSATIDKAKHTNPLVLNRIADNVLPQIQTNMGNTDMMSVMMAILTDDMTASVGWPFNVEGWSHGAWYAVPRTMKSNVSELHENHFGQPGYEPSQTVQEISKKISYKTGLY